MFGIQSSASKSQLTALNAVTANIMIADKHLNITFMNEAVKTLLSEVESDLRKELPKFEVATLIGKNIDVFHKNPSHQRNMLSALQNRHKATIKIGSQIFDLTVTPLKSGNEVTGFVVEWFNAKERLLNVDYTAQIAAISRSQAIIEFNTDGEIITANTNFLRLMGYTLEEIKGKHHRIFVEDA